MGHRREEVMPMALYGDSGKNKICFIEMLVFLTVGYFRDMECKLKCKL